MDENNQKAIGDLGVNSQVNQNLNNPVQTPEVQTQNQANPTQIVKQVVGGSTSPVQGGEQFNKSNIGNSANTILYAGLILLFLSIFIAAVIILAK